MSVSYQQKGPDVGNFVELHKKPQSLLVVTAVLAIYRETRLLKDKTNARQTQVLM